MNQQFVICIKNDDYEVSLETRKLYQYLSDVEAENMGEIRVIDELGEDYLYPKDYFVSINLPYETGQAIIKIA